MTDKLREAAQQALEALERGMFHRDLIPLREKAITTLRAALAEHEAAPKIESTLLEDIAVAAEREACAKLCEDVGNRDSDTHAYDAAAAIRSRGEK